MKAVLDPTESGIAAPPEHYYFALGLIEGAAEAQVVVAYRELLEDPELDERTRVDAERAHPILRAWFRRERELRAALADDPLVVAPPVTRDRRHRGGPAVTRPAEHHFQVLGVQADVTLELIAVAEQRCARAFMKDPDGKRLGHEVRRSASVLRAWLNRRARAQKQRLLALKEAADAARAIQQADCPVDANSQVAHYLSILGLEAEPTLEQLKEAYALGFARVATMGRVEGLKARATMRHAYRVLRRILAARRRAEREAAKLEQEAKARRARRRPWIVLPMLAVTFIVMNLGRFRSAMTDFEVGDVVALRADGSVVGTVVAFEPQHRFPKGGAKRAGAYQLRLAGSSSTNWVTATYAKAALIPLAGDAPEALALAAAPAVAPTMVVPGAGDPSSLAGASPPEPQAATVAAGGPETQSDVEPDPALEPWSGFAPEPEPLGELGAELEADLATRE